MGILGSVRDSHPLMNILNFALRFCQLVLAIATLGLYASYLSFENRTFKGLREKKAVRLFSPI